METATETNPPVTLSQVRKRNLTLQDWEPERLRISLGKVFEELGQHINGDLARIVGEVTSRARQRQHKGVVDSSTVHELACTVLAEFRYHDAAFQYAAQRADRKAGHWPRIYTTEGIHPFDQVDWKIAHARIVSGAGEVIFEQKDIEVPAWWEQRSIDIVADKYFRVINGVRENSVKQVLSRVCRKLRDWAEEQNFFNTPKDADVYEEELIFACLHQYGAFNSPAWFNLGVPGRRQMASACFINGLDDSLEGIMDYQHAEIAIFRSGSGSGANLSTLRSSHEKITAGSYTSGPLSFMRGTDQYAGAMKSGGATRNAAKMNVMDMDHPDILETRDGRPGFIRCKAAAEKMAHDLVSVGYSTAYDDPNGAYKLVPFQNANHSVSVPDAFMTALDEDRTWDTTARTGSKSVIGTYKAKEMWREIAQAAWVCGDPGVQFSDTINRWHTTPKSGRIRGSNPCSEFLHVDNTACNLCALNLIKFFDKGQFQPARFAQAARLFSTAQMAITCKADYPTDAIRENSHKLRPIGLNYGNLGGLLLQLGHPYDSNEGRAIAARLASLMTGHAYVTAARLAARCGAFPEFQRNRADMLRVMGMHQEANAGINQRWQLEADPLGLEDYSDRLWEEVIALGQRHGYYISQASLQAPLGTISYLMGMDSTGIEPFFSLVSYKTLVGGGFMTLAVSGIKDGLLNLGYDDLTAQSISDYVTKEGTIEGAPGLKPEHLPVFDCASPAKPGGRCLTPRAHLLMMAAIQPLITCAQSKTVNLPNSITVDEIADIYRESHRLGIKCVALYRDGCKASQPLSATKAASKTPADAAAPAAPEKVTETGPRREKLPADISSTRHKFDIAGHKGYIVVGHYPDGRPGEVFINLGKPGSTVSGIMNCFTRLLSIALQWGVPLPDLVRAFVDTRFEPAGLTKHPVIRMAQSIPDYLFKYLDVQYLSGEYSGLSDRIQSMQAVEQARESLGQEVLPKPAAKRALTVTASLDAPLCSRCGQITQRNGSCHVCPQCGTSNGCS